MGALQVQQKPEAIEVPLDIIMVRVPFLKRQRGRELRLRGCLKADRNGRDPDL
jgi:hypothetical protein